MLGIEHHGPFEKPGKLFQYALRENMLTSFEGFWQELKEYCRSTKLKGRSVLEALDEWVAEDLGEREWSDGARALLVDDLEYEAMLKHERQLERPVSAVDMGNTDLLLDWLDLPLSSRLAFARPSFGHHLDTKNLSRERRNLNDRIRGNLIRLLLVPTTVSV